MKKSDKKAAVRPGIKAAIKWAVFIIIMFIGFSASTSGNGGPVGLVLFPLALCVAVYEKEIPAAVFGACAGLLLDLSLGKLPGFTALWLLLSCAGTSALFSQLLRKNIVNYLISTAVSGGLYLWIDYYFYYKIWAFEGYRLVLRKILWPSALKTLLWSLPVFLAVYMTERLSGEFRKLELEEQDKNIERV